MGRWSDLSTSRWIAKADIQDGINTGALTLIASAPGIGNEQFISRTQMEAWISSTGTGASNQFQVKSGTVFPPPTGHTIYWPGEVNIATTPALACAETTAYTVYSECSTLNDGCKVWNSLGLWTAEPTYMSEWYKTSDGRTFKTNSSGVIYNMQNCPPTYYYYTGVLCGGGTSVNFRSTVSNLDSAGLIVRAWCATCGGGSEQCFDNISVTTTVNSNDVISTHPTCIDCTGGTTTTSTTTTSTTTSTTTTTTSTTTTTTTTAPPVYSFSGCGVSDFSQLNACADAGSNPKTLYSTCSTLGVGCVLYLDSDLLNPIIQIYVKADGSNWDMDGGGMIVSYSGTQC